MSTAEMELRAGVQPIDELLDEHRFVRKKLAVLWAKYGPGGVADSIRKAERSRIAEHLRVMAAAEGRKVTEASLAESAECHKDYADLLAFMSAERAEYFELNAQLQEIEFKINRGQAMLRFATAEIVSMPG